MRAVWLITATAITACTEISVQRAGQTAYQGNCAACHGTGAAGDGPLAGALPTRPADLTRLAAQNGGVFPRERVMAKIHGYPGQFQTMPAFGPLLQGPDVIWHDSDGIALETPRMLLDLVAYLESVQQPG